MAPPSPRKPLPQPVEETKRSSHRSGNDGTRSLPQPVETSSTTHSSSSSHSRHASSSSSSTKGSTAKSNSESSNKSRDASGPRAITSNQPEPLASDSSSSKPRRKFAPEMIETSRRSRRNTASDTSSDTARDENGTPPASNHESISTPPAHHPQEHLPLHMRRKRPDLAPCPPDNSPIASVEAVPQVPPESKFSSSKLAEKVPRRHSFRIPDLPAIKSNSETEEDSTSSSDDPSLVTIPSAESDLAKHARRKRRRKKTHPMTARDSEDERFSGYLLALAASAAEKQLRDQALAAYPNEHVHEQVNHWAGDQDSDDDSEAAIHVGKLDVNEPEDISDDEEDNISQSRESRRHRESAAGWDMQEMRKHQSRLEEQRQNAWASKNDTVEPELGARRKSVAQQQQHQHGALPAFQKDNETTTMRKAASPPMAGEDLRFPKCLSPQQTRLDVHQYPKSRGDASSKQQQEHTGLWTPGGGASRKSSHSGLWMGVNAASAQHAYASQKTIHTGLLTPALERGDPFSNSSFSTKPAQSQRSSSKSSTNLQLPLTPPATTLQPLKTPALPSAAATDSAAGVETSPLPQTKSLAEEFPDEFVPQLDNDLSLG